ncbi:AraC family transcriptional regulator [Metasolibacillus meyeri]|uniref:AraC family transcriptional regulator n=1 Tax=Metasolibacillus meyeri TaxID=1071052 RepID=UPI000D31446F|nr:GyrI-like domain-containing protein [Metasolibacillus meyeri]
MNITIEELPASRIAYFRSVGEYGGEKNKELMEAFKEWTKLHAVFEQSTILGMPQDNPAITAKEDCRYDVCMMISEGFIVTPPAQVGRFSGGKYAVFLLDHTKEAVSEFWRNVFFEIERNHLFIREQPIIERYTAQMIDQHLCEILVPIQ